MKEHFYTIEYLENEIRKEKEDLKYSEAAFGLAEQKLCESGTKIKDKTKRIIGLEESLLFLISQNGRKNNKE